MDFDPYTTAGSQHSSAKTCVYNDGELSEGSLKRVRLMSRRDYEEGYEDARREMEEREFGSPRRGSDGAFTTAVFIKYLALVIIVIIIAYIVLRLLNTLLVFR